MKKIMTIFAVIFLLAACADMNEIQQVFLDKGEQVYVGKADTLVVHGGYQRVKISGMMYYAKTAEKSVIRWILDGSSDSVVVQAAEWESNNDTLSVIIEGLNEGTQRFFVQNYDKEGNKSLNVEVSGNVYGDQYIVSATPKIITQLTPLPEGMLITWNMSDEAIGVQVKYESNNGEQFLKEDAKAATSLLPDWKLAGTVQTRTILLPEEGALDTLYTEWSSPLQFPESVEFTVVKNKIQHMGWSRDAVTGYSGTYSGVFDGVFGGGGNQFHSGNDVGVPQHLTFDLNVKARLTRFEIYARDDNYHNWNPKKIQIWGIGEISDNSEVQLSSRDAGWEDEARSKGWNLLTENISTHPISNNFTVTDPQEVRYIILRTTEVHGGPATGSGAYVILREVTLFADSILPVD